MTFRENKPIYLQIAEQIMDKIERGELSADGRVPSVREYASGVGVNPNTVMRSYDWLEQSGLIYNQRGIGFFVSESAKESIMNMRREDFFKNELDYFLQKLHIFGVSPEQLKEVYLKYFNKIDGVS